MPHPASKLATTALRLRIVRLWNKGDKTQAQIAAEQGLTRGVVGRLLSEARAKRIYVLSYTPSEGAIRANVGEANYHQRMVNMARMGTAAAKAKRQQGTSAG